MRSRDETKSDVQNNQPLLVRVEEAAKLLSLSRSKIYELMAQKKIVSISVGSARRIIVDSLHAFVAEHQR